MSLIFTKGARIKSFAFLEKYPLKHGQGRMGHGIDESVSLGGTSATSPAAQT